MNYFDTAKAQNEIEQLLYQMKRIADALERIAEAQNPTPKLSENALKEIL